MTNRLDIFEERYSFIIAWDDEGYPGLALGEAADDDEHKAATKGAASLNLHTKGAGDVRSQALAWETITDARKALRAARAAVKQFGSKKPWPDWALKAVSEGWKPPKGWKP